MTRLNTEMKALDVHSIHRVGDKKTELTTRHSPQIYYSPAWHQARCVIFKARNDLRKPGKTPQDFDPEIETEDSQDDQLYEVDINQRGIFINEDLIRKLSNLLWKARQMKKEKNKNPRVAKRSPHKSENVPSSWSQNFSLRAWKNRKLRVAALKNQWLLVILWQGDG